MKRSIIVHPIFFALYPVLFLFSYNKEQVAFSEIVFSISIVLSCTLGIFCIFYLFFKDLEKSGLFTTFLLIIFFSYGHVYLLIKDLLHGYGFPMFRSLFIIPIIVVVLLLVFIYLFNSREDQSAKTKFFNVMGIVLLISCFTKIIIYETSTINNNQIEIVNDLKVMNEFEKLQIEVIGRPRDIYYIILDGYASDRTLRKVYDYNNNEFYKFLEKTGFYIAHNSNSNYPMTFLSLASTLNMVYLNELSSIVKTTHIVGSSKDRLIPYAMLRNNLVMSLLKSVRYKYVTVLSLWEKANINKFSDFNYCGIYDNFFPKLMQPTPLFMYFPYVQEFFALPERERVLCTIETLNEVSIIPGPKFVYAHIISPHPPYLFDRDGNNTNYIKRDLLAKKTAKEIIIDKSRFIDQLIFINKKIKKTIEEILSKYDQDNLPIIILQSDHGPSSMGHARWDEIDSKGLMERMGILNAYFLPGVNYKDNLYDTISPANSFRIILNQYFNTDLKLLPDLNYFSTYDDIYNFKDVTSEIISSKNH